MSRRKPDEVRKAVIHRYVNKGETQADACRHEGVHPGTGGTWMREERDLVLANAERCGLEQAARQRDLDPERVRMLWAPRGEPVDTLEERVERLESELHQLRQLVRQQGNQTSHVVKKFAEHLLVDHQRGAGSS